MAARTFDTLQQKVVRPYIALPAAPLPTALSAYTEGICMVSGADPGLSVGGC